MRNLLLFLIAILLACSPLFAITRTFVDNDDFQDEFDNFDMLILGNNADDPDYIFENFEVGNALCLYVVPDDWELFINDDIEIEFDENVRLVINGSIVDGDDENNPTLFRRCTDAAYTGEAWSSITIIGEDGPLDNNGRVDLENCHFNGGGSGNIEQNGCDWRGLIVLDTDDPGDGHPVLQLTNCTLEESENHGIVAKSVDYGMEATINLDFCFIGGEEGDPDLRILGSGIKLGDENEDDGGDPVNMDLTTISLQSIVP